MVLVCGEALVDVVRAGDGLDVIVPGGGAFNTARALARLGTPTSFLGRLSTDPLGHELARRLTADGVDLALTSVGPEPTTRALAAVDSHGLASYEFHVEGTSALNLTPDMLPADLPPTVTALHAGSLGLVVEPMASTLAGLLRRESGRHTIMVDPNIRPAVGLGPDDRDRLLALLALSTIVKASAEDLDWLHPRLDAVAAAEQVLRSGARLVVVTLGAGGAVGVTPDCHVRVSAPRVDVVDTIGAGDTFGAAVLADLASADALRPDLALSPGQLRSTLDFACRAASITCTRAGAEPPWRSELL